jgi:4-hydroxybenzoate polyprenyltransferase
MNLVGAFFKLIRWPNLVFIALTQLLFYFCIYRPLFLVDDFQKLSWLITASVLIAAAGYIINDYFDLNIDQVNKPDKNVLVRTVKRRWAIVWHFVLNMLGLLATAIAAGWSHWYLVPANFFCILLLWFYSTSFKKKLLLGNIVISVLTAWTVLVLFFAYSEPSNAFHATSSISVKFFRIAFLYAAFAFIISLVREAVKDMEDLEGDARYGCKTLPIVAGIRTTKIYTLVWLVVLIGALVILQLYVLQFGWWLAVVYSFLAVIFPLITAIPKIQNAHTVADFAKLSRITKWVMLTGILSMVFFLIYF